MKINYKILTLLFLGGFLVGCSYEVDVGVLNVKSHMKTSTPEPVAAPRSALTSLPAAIWDVVLPKLIGTPSGDNVEGIEASGDKDFEGINKISLIRVKVGNREKDAVGNGDVLGGL